VTVASGSAAGDVLHHCDLNDFCRTAVESKSKCSCNHRVTRSTQRQQSWGALSLLRASVKRCSASLKRFKVSLQPASGRGIQRWRPIIEVFCLFCCKIGLIILIDYIYFAYLAVLLTKECIIELILLSFRKKNLFTKLVFYKQIGEALPSVK